MRALERMHQEQTPVRVEIERLGVRFKTFVMLRKDVVAVSRPMGFKGEVPAGTTIRLRVPGRSRRELRLEVVNADYRLPTGRAFFICAMPRRWAPKSARGAERYNTGRFTNLELVLPGYSSQYRVLDLSLKGCRIDVGREQLESIWTPGEPVSPAIVQVGSGIRINLDGVVPRSMQRGTVGLEFRFPKDGKAEAHMEKLVAWLNQREDKQSRVIKE